MADIIHNREELLEVVREAAEVVFDAWIRLAEKEKKKKAEQPAQMTVEQMKYVNKVMEDMGCPPAIPWVDRIEEKNRSSASLQEADDGRTV